MVSCHLFDNLFSTSFAVRGLKCQMLSPHIVGTFDILLQIARIKAFVCNSTLQSITISTDGKTEFFFFATKTFGDFNCSI